MKTAAVLAYAALAITAASAVDIPVEHIQQFVLGKASIAKELAQWKDSVAGQVAKKNGYYKEEQPVDAVLNDNHLKRFFLTKLSIAEAEKANPEATFSINTPFTLMTDEEFAQYVKRSSATVDGLNALAAANITTVTIDQPQDNSRKLATTLDWTTSGCVAGVKDQGQCGSCWAFSSVGALESANCLKTGALELFSDQQVTSCDPKSGGCNGGATSYALQYVKSKGSICTADSYPYTSGDGTTGTCNTSSCTAKTLSISSITSVSGTEAALISAIAKQPVAVAVAAGNNAWKQYSGGVLSSCETTDLDHAVLAVGYDTTSFKLKNQWGTWWGDGGYIKLKRNGANSACSVVNPYSVYPNIA
uniref:Peptidase C1A papain C-terminal domain-containing protein n=1 Tax=Globisporangium ultimum (strain ATCC 200006 / CBS 805.95 / DAOM BR144) TaxID=431595 RepID=K3WFK9_GLOUD